MSRCVFPNARCSIWRCNCSSKTAIADTIWVKELIFTTLGAIIGAFITSSLISWSYGSIFTSSTCSNDSNNLIWTTGFRKAFWTSISSFIWWTIITHPVPIKIDFSLKLRASKNLVWSLISYIYFSWWCRRHHRWSHWWVLHHWLRYILLRLLHLHRAYAWTTIIWNDHIRWAIRTSSILS